jgi:hypothetical protein
MAKVVAVDNFDRDSVADSLIVEGVEDMDADIIAAEWNKTHCNYEGAPRYALVKADDYRLSRGMEDLV